MRAQLPLFALLAGCAAAPARPTPLDARSVRLGDSAVVVSLEPEEYELPERRLMEWVARCAGAVEQFFGRFPVRRVHLRLEPSRGARVGFGTTWPGRPARIRVFLGRGVTPAALDAEWMLTHEMIHLAWPSMDRRHHWIEEGLATYLEPLARYQHGMITREELWRRLVRGMPNGQPAPGDGGLDRTPTWGRTYWGGAMFCLVADIGIRKATRNSKGLRDALRGVCEAGGCIDQRWPIRRALAAGDAATGNTVLSDLYEAWRETPVTVDLDALWRDLGVSVSANGAVAFDENAALAPVRRGIETP